MDRTAAVMDSADVAMGSPAMIFGKQFLQTNEDDLILSDELLHLMA